MKKAYAVVDSLTTKFHEFLLENQDLIQKFINSEFNKEYLKILVACQDLVGVKQVDKVFEVMKQVLENGPDDPTLKVILFLLRRTMCTNLDSLIKAYDIYVSFYSKISSKEIKQKQYWYPIKIVLLSLIQNYEALKDQRSDIDRLVLCSYLMKFLMPRDEYALMEIFSIIFEDDEVLKTFFLGYCINVEVATETSKEFYDLSEPAQKRVFNSPHLNPYLPLEEDWFIKPIGHSKKANLEGESSKKDQLNTLCKLGLINNIGNLFTKIISHLCSKSSSLDRLDCFPEPSITFRLLLMFVSEAYLTDKSVLVTDKICENAMSYCNFTEKLSEIPNFPDLLETCAKFLEEFGFWEPGSEFVARGLLKVGEKTGKTEEIKARLQEIWHCLEDAIQEYDQQK